MRVLALVALVFVLGACAACPLCGGHTDTPAGQCLAPVMPSQLVAR